MLVLLLCVKWACRPVLCCIYRQAPVCNYVSVELPAMRFNSSGESTDEAADRCVGADCKGLRPIAVAYTFGPTPLLTPQ